MRTSVTGFFTNGYNKNSSVPKMHANGNYYKIMIAGTLCLATRRHTNFSDHTTALQVQAGGGLDIICALQHL